MRKESGRVRGGSGRRGMGSRSLAGALRVATRSLTVRCLGVLAAYAFALGAIAFAVGAAGEFLLATAFPSMETVLAHEGDLEHDRFGALRDPELSSCHIAVFDGDGARLYASDDVAAKKIRASYLPLINDYREGLFYEVFSEQVDGEPCYRIMMCSTTEYDVLVEAGDADGGADVLVDAANKRIDAQALLDADLNVLDGDLFSGRTSLSRREFNFIKGMYDARMSVERLDYQTADGDLRTLVLAAPLVNDAAYQRVVDDAGRIALLAIPAGLIATVVAAWGLARLMRRAARPLDRAIETYRNGGEVTPAEQVPRELMATYDNFTDLMDRLRTARLERQQLIADVSHDLKTPLTVIGGYAQALADGVVPPDKAPGYLRSMRDRAQAAGELIDLLFSFSKMEHPAYEPHLLEIDVACEVRRAADEARGQVESAGCTLEVCAEDPARALVDVQLLRRSVLNLIDNACVHNEPGVRIRVACARDEGSGFVTVSVSDTGKGVDPAIAERIFEPFATSDEARAAGCGTGLGLSIVRRAAEVMGGRAFLDTAVDAPWSTRFVLELPRAEEADR